MQFGELDLSLGCLGGNSFITDCLNRHLPSNTDTCKASHCGQYDFKFAVLTEIPSVTTACCQDDGHPIGIGHLVVNYTGFGWNFVITPEFYRVFLQKVLHMAINVGLEHFSCDVARPVFRLGLFQISRNINSRPWPDPMSAGAMFFKEIIMFAPETFTTIMNHFCMSVTVNLSYPDHPRYIITSTCNVIYMCFNMLSTLYETNCCIRYFVWEKFAYLWHFWQKSCCTSKYFFSNIHFHRIFGPFGRTVSTEWWDNSVLLGNIYFSQLHS